MDHSDFTKNVSPTKYFPFLSNDSDIKLKEKKVDDSPPSIHDVININTPSNLRDFLSFVTHYPKRPKKQKKNSYDSYLL